jgi:hypothetical protein
MAVGAAGVLKSHGIDTWDSVHAHLLWGRAGDQEPSLVTQLTIGWIDPNTTSALSDQRMKIIGGIGRLELDQKDRGIALVDPAGGIQHVNPYFADYLPDADGRTQFQGYGYESIACFLDDVRALSAGERTLAELEPIRPTLRQSLVSTAVVEAVNESLTHGSEWRPIDANG